MKKDNIIDVKTGLIFFIIYFAIQILAINNISLWDIDEGRYLIPAQNAIDYGKWIVPEYNGSPRITKPPLVVWEIAISSLLFNDGKVTEWSARIPIIIAGAITLLITYLISRKMLSRETSILAVMILSSCNIFLYYIRSPITDMTLLMFMTITLYMLLLGLRENKNLLTLLSFIPMTLGFLTKGPVAILLPLIVIISYSIVKLERPPKKFVIYLSLSLTITISLSLIWSILVGIEDFFREVILEENLKRFSTNYSWESSTFYYIPDIIAKFSPWSAFIPVIFKYFKEEKDEKLTFFVTWFFTILIFFSLSVTKRSSYILFSYPALSIITAHSIQNIKDTKMLNLSKNLSIIIFGIFILFNISKLIYWKSYNYAIISAITGMIFIITILYSFFKKLFYLSISLAFSIYYILVFQPFADRSYHSAKICMEKIKKIVDNQTVLMYGSTRANELYYLDRRVLEDYEPGRNGYIIVRVKKGKTSEEKFGNPIICCKYEESELCLHKK